MPVRQVEALLMLAVALVLVFAVVIPVAGFVQATFADVQAALDSASQLASGR